MAEIRAFADQDVSPVATLFSKVFQEARGASHEDVCRYLRSVFLEHPWYDPAIASRVSCASSGAVIGFLGVVPRRMIWKGRPMRMAISLNLMVEPDQRASLAGVQLLQALFRGPQDLTVTDGAGEDGRKVWEGLGGETTFAYSLYWSRALRPARILRARLRQHRRWLAAGMAPLTALVDNAVARLQLSPLHLAPRGRAEDATLPQLLECLQQFTAPYAVRPEYDERALVWLLGRNDRLQDAGKLRTAVVRDAKGEIAGSYVFSLTPDRRCSAVQILGRRETFSDVLDVLFHDAWTRGADFVTGRLRPEFVQEYSDRYCLFDRRGGWTQIHSRHPELLDAFRTGRAFFTRLEGEWALRFQHW